MTYKRLLLVSDEDGIFLGECLGMAFWSKLDPVGQEAAVAFANRASLANYIAEWSSMPRGEIRLVEVCCKDPNYATIEEIKTAGLDGWDPSKPADLEKAMTDPKDVQELVPHGLQPHEFYGLLEVKLAGQQIQLVGWQSKLLDVTIVFRSKVDTGKTGTHRFTMEAVEAKQISQIDDLVKQVVNQVGGGALLDADWG